MTPTIAAAVLVVAGPTAAAFARPLMLKAQSYAVRCVARSFRDAPLPASLKSHLFSAGVGRPFPR
jgi:hypothetical protein